jgi:hypothetical protein
MWPGLGFWAAAAVAFVLMLPRHGVQRVQPLPSRRLHAGRVHCGRSHGGLHYGDRRALDTVAGG